MGKMKSLAVKFRQPEWLLHAAPARRQTKVLWSNAISKIVIHVVMWDAQLWKAGFIIGTTWWKTWTSKETNNQSLFSVVSTEKKVFWRIRSEEWMAWKQRSVKKRSELPQVQKRLLKKHHYFRWDQHKHWSKSSKLTKEKCLKTNDLL